jgi:hypothetical protein
VSRSVHAKKIFTLGFRRVPNGRLVIGKTIGSLLTRTVLLFVRSMLTLIQLHHPLSARVLLNVLGVLPVLVKKIIYAWLPMSARWPISYRVKTIPTRNRITRFEALCARPSTLLFCSVLGHFHLILFMLYRHTALPCKVVSRGRCAEGHLSMSVGRRPLSLGIETART